MNNSTELTQFIPSDEVSHVEIASVNYDQWILTVAIRLYNKPDQNVIEMVHVVFEKPIGFRLLDESDMLNFPWTALTKSQSFVHQIDADGWYDMETRAKNFLPKYDNLKEYVVKTDNECVSVIAYSNPICIPQLTKALN